MKRRADQPDAEVHHFPRQGRSLADEINGRLLSGDPEVVRGAERDVRLLAWAFGENASELIDASDPSRTWRLR